MNRNYFSKYKEGHLQCKLDSNDIKTHTYRLEGNFTRICLKSSSLIF